MKVSTHSLYFPILNFTLLLTCRAKSACRGCDERKGPACTFLTITRSLRSFELAGRTLLTFCCTAGSGAAESWPAFASGHGGRSCGAGARPIVWAGRAVLIPNCVLEFANFARSAGLARPGSRTPKTRQTHAVVDHILGRVKLGPGGCVGTQRTGSAERGVEGILSQRAGYVAVCWAVRSFGRCLKFIWTCLTRRFARLVLIFP